MPDLDTIPFPAYHLVDWDKYKCRVPSEVKALMKRKAIKSNKFCRVVASRGCTGRCSFCSSFSFWGCKYRIRSSKNVVDELELLNKTCGLEWLNFADDTFTANKNWIIDLCNDIINRKLKIIWDCETRIDFVDDEMLGWMERAGCYSINFGVESGSREILKNLNKGFELGKVIETIHSAKKFKISSAIFMMVGSPGETEESIRESVELIRKARPDKVIPSITMVFPGTALYQKAKDLGLINDGYWLTDRPAPYYSILEKRYSLSQLRRWVDLLIYEDSPQPQKFLRKLRNTIDVLFGIRVTQYGIEFWHNDAVKLRIKWSRKVSPI
jgi:radical SAM superfamily enzyme YgiQ (UPF0313 family)